MFTKNQLFELFNGVIYYTDNPKTFQAISLTCKDFAKLCHAYAPMKKNEYKRKIQHLGLEYYVLPNGAVHQIFDFTYNTGKLKTIEDNYQSYKFIYVKQQNPLENYSYNVNKLYDMGFWDVNGRQILRIINYNIVKHKSVLICGLRFFLCPLCDKIHNFEFQIISRYNFDNIKMFTISWNCLGALKIYKNEIYESPFNNAKFIKRLKIAKSVILYAKQNKTN